MRIFSKVKIFFSVFLTIRNWPIYFFDYFGLRHGKEVFYKLKNGLTFFLRPSTNDRILFNQVWLKKVYEPKGFEIKERDTVIDIGAHVGFFSVLAARKAIRGWVYSFEPAPQNLELFQRNITRNDIKNIVPYQKAVAQIEGEKEFILYSGSTGAHSFAYSDTGEGSPIKVRTTTLEKILEENNISVINFLKMDCEGAEYEILFNCSAETLAKVQKIAMEYHDIDETRNSLTLKEFLEKNGFRVKIETEGDSMLYAVR